MEKLPDWKKVRILSVSDLSTYGLQAPKFVVEQKFLGFWIRLRKPCLNVTSRSSNADYHDRHGRGYSVVYSDGNCRTYDEALEFFRYKPMNLYMLSKIGRKVLELWANNDLARNFVGAGTPYSECSVSRIGLFLNISPTETHFEPKGYYWESFYLERYRTHKIIS